MVVPILTILEVYRRLAAIDAAGADEVKQNLLNYPVIPVEAVVLEKACWVARRHRLHLADSIIYATAQLHHATLWTQDAHFANLPGVQYLPKPISPQP